MGEFRRGGTFGANFWYYRKITLVHCEGTTVRIEHACTPCQYGNYAPDSRVLLSDNRKWSTTDFCHHITLNKIVFACSITDYEPQLMERGLNFVVSQVTIALHFSMTPATKKKNNLLKINLLGSLTKIATFSFRKRKITPAGLFEYSISYGLHLSRKKDLNKR